MNPVLELRDAHRRYGSGATEVVALNGVNLSVAPGELIAVMGPSGSGKSTLLNLAGGLDRASGGAVIVDGVDIANLPPAGLASLRRTHVGIVFQELNLLPMLTAAENVMLPLELGGTRTADARKAARTALGQVGLGGKRDRYPDDLSGGEQQRVAIARPMVGERPPASRRRAHRCPGYSHRREGHRAAGRAHDHWDCGGDRDPALVIGLPLLAATCAAMLTRGRMSPLIRRSV